MTKADKAPDAAPRRSTRVRTKRRAEPDADDVEAEAEPTDAASKPVQKASKRKQTAKPSAHSAAAQTGNAATTDSADEAPANKPAKKGRSGKASQPAVAKAPSAKQTTAKHAKTQANAPAAAPQKANQSAAAKPAPTSQSGSNRPGAADSACPKANSTSVFEDFDVMLNQTNIGANNNKFYRMQLLQEGTDHWLWTRWGRVGDKGQTQLQGPFDESIGQNEFKKKFRSKVGAAFEDKDAARQVRSGKYSLVDLDSFQSPPTSPGASKPAAKLVIQHEKSKLEPPTEELMNLIFSDIMFQQAMQEFDIDTERLPLGQLSKDQVQRGYDVLERLRAAINGGGEPLERLSSEFYQVIPHNFGRQRPPVLASLSMVENKIRMCDVLNDIEVAQDLLEPKQKAEDRIELQPNPADEKYATLKADLKVMTAKEEEYKVIEKYCKATGRGEQLLNVWRVDRHSEAAGFAKHAKLDNRKLLWHGTNIAVVAAILKAGLRIMPHACGRVGKGLYLASEHSKSAAYVSCGRKGHDLVGVMFLAEAALGQEHHITVDDSSLRAPPSGFHSVVAKGHTEPDPSQDAQLELDGQPVHVPQGKPVQMPEFKNSSFMQSEYLLYQESQARIRYMLTMKFNHAGSWR